VQWTSGQLFGGAIQTYHAIVDEQFTCDEAATEAHCVATPAGYARKTTSVKALVPRSGGQPLVWMPVASRLQAGTADADGDRYTESGFFFESKPEFYRLRPLTTEKRVRDGGNLNLYAKAATTWDSDYKAKLTEEIWFDPDDKNRAIAHYEYDMATGNLRKRWKPEQYALNKFTEYTYDSRQLFIATEINERGHRVDHTYEYGTGTKLMTEGPNQRTCTTGWLPARRDASPEGAAQGCHRRSRTHDRDVGHG
jgi:hypothetical protein